mmetsp:Transcript_46718/g.77321  ORF Transcript_46718/g.77321 Transcript_46718/m.77321 type:complete len:488 (+) Transcript_46718:126-1589(+)|eukprot:CAMPEP_0119306800 /NCGR_PEP_ID=MMETSP1333-20130426/7469_1 /TAXON_ID=418940 /ORGANISM="Scyphosphaera apsteinii, Strain RCC1455" /LENGTH=487 /DNA_ID=CAMNT_0007310199 /DNA_START=126 /DNA_END=1589 /DNA_ORIENTATION=-
MTDWKPPTLAAQKAAIGLRTAPKDLAPWLQPNLYPPIAEPDEDDWGRGKGQTFEKYVAGNQRVGRKAKRIKIYLQPLGNAEQATSFPSLATLAEGVSAFYGMECAVLPMMTLKELEARGKVKIRTRGKKRQVNANDINNNLKAFALPADGFTLCAVTMHDLYKGDFNYLFGLAFLTAHVGVFSFYRHQPNVPECEYHHGRLERQPGDEAVLLRRGYQTLSHELGHTFGLKHCVYFSCLMQGANSLEEAEGRMTDLCPVCLRKLLWCVNTESSPAVRARYERLHAFFSAQPQSFGNHLAWVRSRLSNPDGGAPKCERCAEEPEESAPVAAAAAAPAPTPCSEARAMAMVVEVSGASVAFVNGVYDLTPGVHKGGRPVWIKRGDDDMRIQWSTRGKWWMIDEVGGPAPYCLPGRNDLTVPLDATWHAYEGSDNHVAPTIRAVTAEPSERHADASREPQPLPPGTPRTCSFGVGSDDEMEHRLATLAVDK